MRELIRGDHIYWYIGHSRCEGYIIDIYRRSPEDRHARPGIEGDLRSHNVLLIQMANGKKVLKLETEVILDESKRNFA
jgi:hypothetical protein